MKGSAVHHLRARVVEELAPEGEAQRTWLGLGLGLGLELGLGLGLGLQG